MPGGDGGALLRTLLQPSVLLGRGMGFQEAASPGGRCTGASRALCKCLELQTLPCRAVPPPECRRVSSGPWLPGTDPSGGAD